MNPCPDKKQDEGAEGDKGKDMNESRIVWRILEEVDVDVGDGRVSEVVEVNLGGKAAKEEVVRLPKMELTLHFRMTQSAQSTWMLIRARL